MNPRYLILSATIVFLFSSGFLLAQSLSVTNGQTPAQLVNALIGPGISPGNIAGSYYPGGSGLFTNNGVSGLSLPAGIILTTGGLDSGYVNAPATYFNSTAVNLPGDADLNTLVTPFPTYDAATLSFDFASTSDSVEFNFTFASEEYNEYVNSSFNDVFAFFITGPGYAPNTNVALLPGTTTTISINNVNNGNSSGTATGPCMNCAFYIDNVGTNAVGLSYDGFTTVINIKFPVWPCTTYQFKASIADVGDMIFDSMVMLEENSFLACPALRAFQNGSEIGDTIVICAGGSATLTAPPGPAYAWTTGESTQSITVNQPGTYSFTIFDPAGTCFAFSDQFTVIQQGSIQTPVIVQNGTALSAPNILPSPNMTFQWFLDGNPLPGETQATLNIPGLGCYTLVIYEGMCESLSNEICVTSVSLNEMHAGNFKLYPHPVTGSSLLQTPFSENSMTTLEWFDLGGRLIKSEQHQGSMVPVEKSGISEGIYLVRISNSMYGGFLNKMIAVQ